jgi:hypothetical protein
VTLDDLKRFFTPRAILNLEREVEYLRGHNNMLLLQLREMSAPKITAPAVKREFPKFTPTKTSWEAFRDAEIAKQETEEAAI